MTRPLLLTATPLLLVLASCRSTPSPPSAQPLDRRDVVTIDGDALERAGVVVQRVEKRRVAATLAVPATVALDDTRTARVGSLQEGLILETRVRVGEQVTRGQLLATMHGHAMHDAWAGYRKAVAERRRAEKELAYATEVSARAQRLLGDRAVSRQEAEQAEVNRVAAVEQLTMARAEVTRSIEELEHVGVTVPASGEFDARQEQTEAIPVRAPMAGTVLERLITPGTTVIPGTPLFVISDLSTVWALAEVDETQLPLVETAHDVSVAVAAYPAETFAATVGLVADVVNPTTRRVVVRVIVPNPSRRLKPGMFATVTLTHGTPSERLMLPTAAVQTIDGTPSVFVAEEGGRFRRRAVSLGAGDTDAVEIAAGVAPGEHVAVQGAFVLKSELLKPAPGSQ
jgi:cobalt-zinc-cadmium efflux system membrane fusion protein